MPESCLPLFHTRADFRVQQKILSDQIGGGLAEGKTPNINLRLDQVLWATILQFIHVAGGYFILIYTYQVASA